MAAPKLAIGKKVRGNRMSSPIPTTQMLPSTPNTPHQDVPAISRNSLSSAYIPEPMSSPYSASTGDRTPQQNDEPSCHRVKRKREDSCSDADEKSQHPKPPKKSSSDYGVLFLGSLQSDMEILASNTQEKLRKYRDRNVEWHKKNIARNERREKEYNEKLVHLGDRMNTIGKAISDHGVQLVSLKQGLHSLPEHKEKLMNLEMSLNSKAPLESLNSYIAKNDECYNLLAAQIMELQGVTQQSMQRPMEADTRKLIQEESVAIEAKIEAYSAARINTTADKFDTEIKDLYKKIDDQAIVARRQQFDLDTRMNGYESSSQTIRTDASALTSCVDVHETVLMELKKNNASDAAKLDRLERTQKISEEEARKIRSDMIDLAKLEKLFEDRMIKKTEELKTDFDKCIEKMQKQHESERAYLLQQHDSERASQQAAIQAMQETMQLNKAAMEKFVHKALKDLEPATKTSKNVEKADLAWKKKVDDRVIGSCREVEDLKIRLQDDHTKTRNIQRTVEKISEEKARTSTSLQTLQQRMNVLQRDLSQASTRQELAAEVAMTKREFAIIVTNTKREFAVTFANMNQVMSEAISVAVDQKSSEQIKEVRDDLEGLSSTVDQVNGAYQKLQMGLGGFLGTALGPTAYPSPPLQTQSHPGSPNLQGSTTQGTNPHTPSEPRPSLQQQFQPSMLSPTSPLPAQVSVPPPARQNMANGPFQGPEQRRRTHSVPQVPPQHVLPSKAGKAPANIYISPYMNIKPVSPRPGGASSH